MQVSPGGQSAPAPVFHTLFAPIDGVSSPDYMPEPIAKIFVTRFESRGQVQALRPFRPEELQDNASVYARFGGGTYELVARREDGTIYAKRLITLEGEPKSMNGEPVASPTPPPQTVGGVPLPNPPAPTGGDTMLHYMMQTNITMMTMLGQVMVAMVSGGKSDAAAQAQAMGESMKATIEVMKAAMPQQQAAPPAPSPVAILKEVLEVQKMITPQAPPPPKPKEETTSDIISALGGALGPFMQLAAGAASAAPGATQAVQAANAIMQG
jgi:hypothetical protein